MSVHQFFKRTAVQPQMAQQLRTVTLPAPTRGLIMNENASFVQPGGAQVLDNWKPTMTGLRPARGLHRGVDAIAGNHASGFDGVSIHERQCAANVRRQASHQALRGDRRAMARRRIVKAGQSSGNYVASQLANQGGDYHACRQRQWRPAAALQRLWTWTTLNYTNPANGVGHQYRLCGRRPGE